MHLSIKKALPYNNLIFLRHTRKLSGYSNAVKKVEFLGAARPKDRLYQVPTRRKIGYMPYSQRLASCLIVCDDRR
jgi:hypothetical protein